MGSAMGWWGNQDHVGKNQKKGYRGSYKVCDSCHRWAHGWRGDKCVCGGSLAWGGASWDHKHSGWGPSGSKGSQRQGNQMELVAEFLEALQQGTDLSLLKEVGTELQVLLADATKGGTKPAQGTPSAKARKHLADLENQYDQALAKHTRLKKQLADAAERVELLSGQVSDARDLLDEALEQEQEELQGKNEETRRATEGISWVGLPIEEDQLEDDPELRNRYKAALQVLDGINREFKSRQDQRRSRLGGATQQGTEIEETPYLGLAGSVIATTAVTHRLDDEDENMEGEGEGEGGASAWATVPGRRAKPKPTAGAQKAMDALMAKVRSAAGAHKTSNPKRG